MKEEKIRRVLEKVNEPNERSLKVFLRGLTMGDGYCLVASDTGRSLLELALETPGGKAVDLLLTWPEYPVGKVLAKKEELLYRLRKSQKLSILKHPRFEPNHVTEAEPKRPLISSFFLSVHLHEMGEMLQEVESWSGSNFRSASEQAQGWVRRPDVDLPELKRHLLYLGKLFYFQDRYFNQQERNRIFYQLAMEGHQPGFLPLDLPWAPEIMPIILTAVDNFSRFAPVHQQKLAVLARDPNFGLQLFARLMEAEEREREQKESKTHSLSASSCLVTYMAPRVTVKMILEAVIQVPDLPSDLFGGTPFLSRLPVSRSSARFFFGGLEKTRRQFEEDRNQQSALGCALLSFLRLDFRAWEKNHEEILEIIPYFPNETFVMQYDLLMQAAAHQVHARPNEKEGANRAARKLLGFFAQLSRKLRQPAFNVIWQLQNTLTGAMNHYHRDLNWEVAKLFLEWLPPVPSPPFKEQLYWDKTATKVHLYLVDALAGTEQAWDICSPRSPNFLKGEPACRVAGKFWLAELFRLEFFEIKVGYLECFAKEKLGKPHILTLHRRYLGHPLAAGEADSGSSQAGGIQAKPRWFRAIRFLQISSSPSLPLELRMLMIRLSDPGLEAPKPFCPYFLKAELLLAGWGAYF